MLTPLTRLDVPGHDVVGIRAANPGPFTLTGTNTWLVGRDPAWAIDPGPALPEHLDAVTAELHDRGGLAGIALTHDHPDHAEAIPELRRRFPDASLAAVRGVVDQRIADGSEVGPLTAVATPGHAPDHVAFVRERIGFTGDAVLGQGSVFIAPDPGALAGYLKGLGRLRSFGLGLLCPGHGPLVTDADARIDAYVAHRLDRERRLLAALRDGRRTVGELLDAAWDDAPAILRPAAAVTLAAHLDKLDGEGRLPEGVERPGPIQLG